MITMMVSGRVQGGGPSERSACGAGSARRSASESAPHLSLQHQQTLQGHRGAGVLCCTMR